MSDCCSTPGLQSMEQALEQIISSCSRISGFEKVSIKNSISRILYTDIQASINVPPFRNSSMDGYALPYPYDEQQPLRIVGTSWAGHPFHGTVKNNECVRIFTGAQLPDDCDSVIMQENVNAQDNEIQLNSLVSKHENIRNIGDDIQLGNTILNKGRVLKPVDLGLIASCGIADVSVYRKLRIAFFSTGDELVPIGSNLQAGQIYDSNRYTLHALIEELGAQAIDLGVIPDNADAVEEALIAASKNNDVIITTGGVSVGEADYIVDVLAQIGQVDLWKIAIKPGKPLAFGAINNCRFFGLPGNPVSTLVTFQQIVRPALEHMMGMNKPSALVQLQATALSTINKNPGRKEFQRGIVKTIDKQLVVEPSGGQGSHILSSLSKANCYIVLEADCAGIKEGEQVTIQLFS